MDARQEEALATFEQEGSPAARTGLPPRTPIFAHLKGPMWARGLRQTEAILPEKSPSATRIAFFGPSDATPASITATPTRQAITRAVTLFLSETLYCCTTASTSCALALARGKLAPIPMAPVNFATMLLACPPGSTPDVLITCYFTRRFLGRFFVLELWQVDTATVIGQIHVKASGNLQEMALKVVSLLAKRLEKAGLLTQVRRRGVFAPPPLAAGDEYLLALEQLCEQILAAEGMVTPLTPEEERERFQRYLQLARRMPDTMAPRLMTIAGVLAGLKIGSPAASHYRSELLHMLQDSNGSADDLGGIAPELVTLLKGS